MAPSAPVTTMFIPNAAFTIPRAASSIVNDFVTKNFKNGTFIGVGRFHVGQ